MNVTQTSTSCRQQAVRVSLGSLGPGSLGPGSYRSRHLEFGYGVFLEVIHGHEGGCMCGRFRNRGKQKPETCTIEHSDGNVAD